MAKNTSLNRLSWNDNDSDSRDEAPFRSFENNLFNKNQVTKIGRYSLRF